MVEAEAQVLNWKSGKSMIPIEIFLSQEHIESSELQLTQLAGFDVSTTMLDPALPIPAEAMKRAEALVVEVRCDQTSSLERIQRLANQNGAPPIIAAVCEPSLGDVRMLMRSRVADVVPLPLKRSELESALGRIRADIETRRASVRPKGRIVSIAKSRGGVGATTILTQIACTAARSHRDGGACLVDLDLQFGNAALYLGQLPTTGITDLLEAGSRADAALLRTLAGEHASGLHFLAAPKDVVPLESVAAEQVADALSLAANEFGLVFVDLPTDWTDWSLSVLARSDRILFVSELNIPNLHQARKQLNLFRQLELGTVAVEIVLNKVEKKLFRPVDVSDAESVLGRDVAWSIAEDRESVSAALDQGLTVEEVNPRSRTSRDLQKLSASVIETVEVAG